MAQPCHLLSLYKYLSLYTSLTSLSVFFTTEQHHPHSTPPSTMQHLEFIITTNTAAPPSTLAPLFFWLNSMPRPSITLPSFLLFTFVLLSSKHEPRPSSSSLPLVCCSRAATTFPASLLVFWFQPIVTHPQLLSFRFCSQPKSRVTISGWLKLFNDITRRWYGF